MGRRDGDYKPSNRQPRILRFATALLVVSLGLAWIFQDKIGIQTGSLFIFTGITGLVLTLSLQNKKKLRDLDVSDSHLEANREKIGTGDYRE
jgi:hypothetical protein